MDKARVSREQNKTKRQRIREWDVEGKGSNVPFVAFSSLISSNLSLQLVTVFLSSHFFSFPSAHRKRSVHVREVAGCRWHASAKKGSVFFVCLFI